MPDDVATTLANLMYCSVFWKSRLKQRPFGKPGHDLLVASDKLCDYVLVGDRHRKRRN